jgi:hypothetical protein
MVAVHGTPYAIPPRNSINIALIFSSFNRVRLAVATKTTVLCVCVCVCVCVRVRPCVRACVRVRASARACMCRHAPVRDSTISMKQGLNLCHWRLHHCYKNLGTLKITRPYDYMRRMKHQRHSGQPTTDKYSKPSI